MNFFLETFSAWDKHIARKYVVVFLSGFLCLFLPMSAWKVWSIEKPATIRLAEESLVQVKGLEVLVHLDLQHQRNFCQGALITRMLVHYAPGVKPTHTNFDYAAAIEETEPYLNIPGEYHFIAQMHLRSALPDLPFGGRWQFIASSFNGCTLLGKLGADTALVSPLVPVNVEK